jgi:hypothetical protein
MTDVAWPFLVTRTRNTDHRFVVIPEVMMDSPRATSLRASIGGTPGKRGTALVQEIQSLPEPMTVVYQVRRARAEDYGIPGAGILTDSAGRPILATEGVLLRGAASAVIKSGVSQAVLDEAHALVAPAYREFWAAEGNFARRAAKPFPLPADGSPSLRLSLPSREQTGSTPPASAHPRPPQEALATAPSADTVAASGTRRSRATVVGVFASAAGLTAAAVTGAVVLAINLLGSHASDTTSRSAAQTMRDLCSDLRSGRSASAYDDLTTSGYRARTTQPGFTSELLPHGTVTTTCTYQVQATSGAATADATMTITQQGTSQSWRVTLTSGSASSWQVASITRR